MYNSGGRFYYNFHSKEEIEALAGLGLLPQDCSWQVADLEFYNQECPAQNPEHLPAAYNWPLPSHLCGIPGWLCIQHTFPHLVLFTLLIDAGLVLQLLSQWL